MGASDADTVPFDQHDSLRNGNSSGISRLDFRFGSCLENVPFTRSLMENIVNSDRLVIFVFSFYDPKNEATYSKREQIRQVVHCRLL